MWCQSRGECTSHAFFFFFHYYCAAEAISMNVCLFRVTQSKGEKIGNNVWNSKMFKIVYVTKWLNCAESCRDCLIRGCRTVHARLVLQVVFEDVSCGLHFSLKLRIFSLLGSCCRITDKGCLRTDWHQLLLFVWPENDSNLTLLSTSRLFLNRLRTVHCSADMKLIYCII